MPQKPENQCLVCHGSNVIDGRIGGKRPSFVPAGKFMWIGYRIDGYVCADCGFVGLRLDPRSLQELRAER
jgi:hypothetical protein